jgi:hypothetical protein
MQRSQGWSARNSRRNLGAHWLHVALLALAVAALHVLFVSYSPGAVLATDSMGYLGTARTLAGAGQPISFDFSAFTAAGYGLLLAPAYLVTVSPHTVFLFGAAVNIAAGASITVGAYLLARELFGVGHRASLLIGVLAATYPAYLLQSGQVWPEVVLAALVVWWTLVLTRFLNNGTIPAAVGCGLVTGFAWATHRRMAAMVIVTLLVLAFVGWRRRDRRVGAVVAACSMLVLIAATWVLERWLLETMWTTPPVNEDSSATIFANLSPSRWGSDALVGLGEGWYLAAASLGLVVLGVGNLLQLSLTRRRFLWSGDARGLAAGALVCAMLGTLLTGALYTGSSTARADFLVYGRYVDEYSAAMITAAGAVIVSSKPFALRRTVSLLLAPAFLVLSAALVYEIRGRGAFVGNVQKLTIPGILGEQVLVEGRTVFSEAIHIRPITLIALGMFIAVLVLARLAPPLALVGATTAFVVLAFIGVTRSLHPFLAFWDDAYSCVPTAVQQRYGSSGELAIDLQGIDPEARSRYQFHLPHYRVVYFDGSRQRPPATLVIAPQDWPSARSDGFIPVTGELASSEALWASTRERPQVPVILPSGAPCPSVSVGS